MEEIKRFNKDAIEDKTLLEEIKAIGNDVEKIVALANSKGYKFTIEDLNNEAQKSGELSEEELGDVAGGFVCVASGKGDFDHVVGTIADAIFVL